MQIARANFDGQVTHFVVQAYRKVGKKLVAEEPRVVKNAQECLRVAEGLSGRRSAVIAFSRTGDMDTGDFDDPVILARYGEAEDGRLEGG